MSFFQVGWSPIMTNKNQVFALKYRPQNFEDLIGHKEISSTIFNSIKNNKIANAYLFTGIRGIGKTTFARIVAKGLNCEKGIQNLCVKNFCSNCESIKNSNHIDVLEIDAASRTGVEDVRELIEFSRYSPTIAKYKVFIIDEVHMLSKQAFNALLKTLEEPPKYLKFIFATTEIKKIPITVLSRCQRYDLSRVESFELFEYLKNISLKENKNIDDNALKLLVKISEGSVRDALSLLDRALISSTENHLSFEKVQKIFGYTNKSSYLNLIELVFLGSEQNVLEHYRNLYNTGIEPSNFLNEFLEVLYYIKNIDYISVDGSNFSLNDDDYKKILSLSKKVNSKEILIYWELTIKTIKEINIVSNQNLLIEMFLVQLMYIYSNNKENIIKTSKKAKDKEIADTSVEKKNILINQIKNIKQIDEKIEKKIDKDVTNLNSMDDLINLCLIKKEMKLKYELENNVNLVSFSKNIIEISFNERLSKNFVKDLSEKLFQWTNKRWIITFSKNEGQMSKNEEKKYKKKNKIEKFKNSDEYRKIRETFSDLELIDILNKND